MPRKTISLEKMDNFEVDDDGRLYWQGERVLTEVRLSLPRAVNIAVISAAAATVLTFLLGVLQISHIIPAPAQAPIEITIKLDGAIIGHAQTTP